MQKCNKKDIRHKKYGGTGWSPGKEVIRKRQRDREWKEMKMRC